MGKQSSRALKQDGLLKQGGLFQTKKAFSAILVGIRKRPIVCF
jgi:hypothetical protein